MQKYITSSLNTHFSLYFSLSFFIVIGIASEILIAGGYMAGIGILPFVEIISNKTSNVQLPNLPKRKGINDSPTMLIHNSSILLCGGFQSSTPLPRSTYKSCLELKTDSWTNHSILKEERCDASSATTTTGSFIFGGASSSNTYEYLEIGTTEWELGETLIPDGFQDGCAIAISEHEIWLIGGRNSFDENRILAFYVLNHIFEVLPIKLNQGRHNHQCTFIPGTKSIIITGGESAYPKMDNLDSTEILNIETGDITMAAPMNFKRREHGIGILSLENQDRVVVFGGVGQGNSAMKTVEVYITENDTWQMTDIELHTSKKLSIWFFDN